MYIKLQVRLTIFLPRDQLRGSSGSLLGVGTKTISRLTKWYARVPSKSTKWTVPGTAVSSIIPCTMFLMFSALWLNELGGYESILEKGPLSLYLICRFTAITFTSKRH